MVLGPEPQKPYPEECIFNRAFQIQGLSEEEISGGLSELRMPEVLQIILRPQSKGPTLLRRRGAWGRTGRSKVEKGKLYTNYPVNFCNNFER